VAIQGVHSPPCGTTSSMCHHRLQVPLWYAWRINTALTTFWIESRMDRMEARLIQNTSQVREEMKQLDGRVARLEHGQAKHEGLLEGLCEAITRRNVA